MKLALVSAILIASHFTVCRADVTLRYKSQIHSGAMLPPQMLDALKHSGLPDNMLVQVKGDFARTKYGDVETISNFATSQILILNSKNKSFAKATSAEFAKLAVSQQPEIPADASQLMKDMKVDVQTRRTGSTRTIQSVPAEERQIVITMKMPTPEGIPSLSIETVQSVWIPKGDEARRNPALQEMSQYANRAFAGTNVTEVVRKALAQMPGFGEKLSSMASEFEGSGSPLAMTITMSIPGLAEMAAQAKAEGRPLPSGLDVSGPIFEWSMNVEELSSGEIPDAVFTVPRDYKEVALGDVMAGALRPGAAARPDAQ